MKGEHTANSSGYNHRSQKYTSL